VVDALFDPMLTVWLQGEHVLEIEAALLLAVQLRRKLPRLAPFYARSVALHALGARGRRAAVACCTFVVVRRVQVLQCIRV
jgi:hypothetical protein